jgi:NADH:ubiquinone oxidoreductase subunit C
MTSNKNFNGVSIEQILPNWVIATNYDKDTGCIFVPKNYLNRTLEVLKNHTLFQFKVLADVTAVDWLGKHNDKLEVNNLESFNSDLRVSRLLGISSRFCLTYNLLSVRYGVRLLIKTFINLNEGIESSTNLYNSANWWERETWDMFGINFFGHPDLRRLLTDYGFRGFPLRKDFPLSGYTETRYDENLKRVVIDQVNLSQEFRYFDLSSPWESS